MIADLTRRNSDLENEAARLAEAVAARDALLAIAGHELRNPMTPILGRVQLLRSLVARPDVDLVRVGKALGDLPGCLRRTYHTGNFGGCFACWLRRFG